MKRRPKKYKTENSPYMTYSTYKTFDDFIEGCITEHHKQYVDACGLLGNISRNAKQILYKNYTLRLRHFENMKKRLKWAFSKVSFPACRSFAKYEK